MINTYNESDLHEKLKTIYALEENGECERQIPGTKWIADVLLKDESVIEIQTGNVSALKEKIDHLLKSKKKIKVVKPIIIEKIIETNDGEKSTSKKSPKKETVYSMLRGLTGVFEELTDENFELVVLFVKCTEARKKTEEKVQILNKSRRHLKNWIPLGKKLNSIEGKRIFKSKSDYANLIPGSVPKKFTKKELTQAIMEESGRESAKWSNLLIWLLLKMEIISETEKRGRAKQYELRLNADCGKSVPNPESD